MEIRKKISLQFTLIVAIIQCLLSLAIYISFAQSRIEEMYARLEAKAKSVGQMLIDIEEIDAALLKKIEEKNPLSMPNEKIIIYNQVNQVLFSNDEQGEILLTSGQIDEVRLYNRVRSKIGDYEVLGKLYTNPKDRVVVFVAAIDLYGFKKLAILRFILVAVFIAGLVIFYFAGRIFAGRAIQPIRKVITEVDKIGATNLNARLEEGSGQDEIARLSAAFNKLLDRLERSFKMQKSFIANASHELNTPLTIITGQLEVVQMKARTNREYAEAINKVLDKIKNLNLLSKKLLMLAQTSTDLPGTSFSLLRIDDLLWQVRSEIQNSYPDFSVSIELDKELDDENQLKISGNELLLKTAFANLIENGCKYSGDHKVSVILSRNNQNLVVHVEDHGAGIPAEDQQMIFQPFYRGKEVKDKTGHGIGLSLADRIIASHNGTISLNSRIGIGSDFVIILPLAGD